MRLFIAHKKITSIKTVPMDSKASYKVWKYNPIC